MAHCHALDPPPQRPSRMPRLHRRPRPVFHTTARSPWGRKPANSRNRRAVALAGAVNPTTPMVTPRLSRHRGP